MNWSLLPSRYHLKYNNSFLKNDVIFWSVALQVSTCKTLLLQVTSAHQMGAQNFAKDASAHPLKGILNLLTTRQFCPSWLSSFKNMLLQLVRNSTLTQRRVNTRVFLPTFRCFNIRWNTPSRVWYITSQCLNIDETLLLVFGIFLFRAGISDETLLLVFDI